MDTTTHDEKVHHVTHDEDDLKKHEVTDVKVVLGDEAFQQAKLKEPPSFIPPFMLLLASMVAFCCSTANGYDGSLYGTLLANQDFKDFFHVDNVGIGAGIVTSIYQIGNVCAIPFIGPAIDTWGRRYGMLIGSSIICLGVIIQIACISTASIGQFMAGRFFLGFGVGIAAAAGPIYTVETSHPAHRGLVTGLYNVMWPVGAMVASGAARGGLEYKGSNTSWMIPVSLQIMFPGFIAVFCLLLPESPRWLFTRGRQSEAKAILARFHGKGNPESEWVKLQINEYNSFLEMEGTDKTWWDYRALFRNRASIYRLACNCIVSLFGQWAGNSIVSYYLSGFLDTAGIKGDTTQTNVQLGMSAIQIVSAAFGAMLVDNVGRRPLLLAANVACGLCWIGVIVPASIANITDVSDEAQTSAVDPSVSKAVLAWVYLFQICYSVGWTPMQALVPVEVLSYEMRAKGMAFSSLFTSAALLATQFGIPVALANIQWRTYIVFCCWCFVQFAVLFLLLPETKNRTLEELDKIFESKYPVKASMEKKKLDVDANANIINVDAVGHRGDNSHA
ncbi:sugar transporter domain-containing protein [Sarocladium implicatum]|nr:sugar transporter domain-containing protein [Sarocladium implicatum]